MSGKLFFSGLLWAFLAFQVQAQGFSGGLRTGLTATEISGDNAGGPEKLGWYASAFTHWDVGPFSRLQLEISFVQKGSRAIRPPADMIDIPLRLNGSGRTDFLEDGPPSSDQGRGYKLNLSYVEIPVTWAFDFASFTSLRQVELLTAEIGLAVSRVVGHYEETDFGWDVTQREAEAKPFRAVELNVLAGLYYPLGQNLSFHLRFTQGVTPVRPHSGGSSRWWNRGQYNTVWAFGVSYTMFAAE